MRRFTTFLVVALTASALAACTSSPDDAVLDAEPAAPTTTTTAPPSSTTTTEPETTTTTVSDADLTDEEQIIELHRELFVDRLRVNEVEGTPSPAEREAWMRQNLVEPQLTQTLNVVASWENDGATMINEGALSNVLEVIMDGETVAVTDCLASMFLHVDGSFDQQTSRSPFYLLQSNFELVEGEWKIASVGGDDGECDPTRAWEFNPPAIEEDEILTAYERFMDFYPANEDVSGHDAVIDQAPEVSVGLLREWFQQTSRQRQEDGEVRSGSSIEHRPIRASQWQDKAVVLACVAYVQAKGEELAGGLVGDGETQLLPSNQWNVYFRKLDGRWLAEGTFTGGQDTCDV